jgi:RNA polymerase sigma-70 factor (ECF subfamily)
MAAPVAAPEVPDEWLAARVQQGDAAAFEALVARYQGPLYHFAYRLLADAEDAEDATQDTLIQVYHALPRARLDQPLRPWIYRIARNRCLDVLKRRRTVSLSALDATDASEDGAAIAASEPLPEELAERADLQRLLTAAIAALAPVYREVVALRYTADLGVAEIAAVLGVPDNTVKIRLHRAKAALRAALRELLTTGTESDA